MEEKDLTELADALLIAKLATLEKGGEAKKKKGKQGFITFLVLFIVFFSGGLFADLLHVAIPWNGKTIDFHEIGQYIFFGALALSVALLIFAIAYFSLYQEGKKELAEVARIREEDHSSNSR
jgi:heme exporter protein D